MTSDPDASPFNALPPVVVALAAVIFGLEALFFAGAEGYIGGPGAVGWRLSALQDYAFSDAYWEWMVQNGRFEAAGLVRFLTYPLIHGGFSHMLFVLVFLLALGKMVGEAFGQIAVLVIFFGSAIFGALVFALVVDSGRVLVGGYPAVYGLIGAFTFVQWVRRGQAGENRAGAFSLIAMLLGIQLLFGALFGGGLDWVAEVGGFLAGFALSFLLVPGGWQRIRARLRQR